MLMSGTMQAALVLEGSSCKGQEGQRVPCAASARRRPGLPACHLHLHLPADCTSPMLLHHPSTKGTCQGPCRHPACRLEAGLSTHAAMPCSATCAAGPAWQLAGPKDQWHLMLQCCLPTCIQGPKLGRSGEAYWRPLPQAACLPLMPAASRSCRRAVWGLLQPASQPGWHVMSTHKVMGAVTVGQAVRMGAGGLVGPLRVAGLMRVAGTNPAQPPAWPPWVHEACRLGRARWLMAPDHDGAAAGGWHTQGMTQGA
jgi:hypothetical protein